MLSMRRARLLLGLLVSAAMVGCQAPPQVLGGKPREKTYTNVISLSPGTTELVMSINYNNILKGRTASDNYPTTAAKVPVIASVKPDYEKIASLKPDLVVYDASLYNEADVAKIKGLGADTFAIDANTIEDFANQVLELGSLIAGETNASGYADRVIASRNSALASPITPTPKVAILMPGIGSPHYIVGNKSFLADAIKSAGGEVVGPDADKFVELSPELLVTQAPTVIVIPASKMDPVGAQKSLGAVLNDPKLQTVPAVKNHKVFAMDADVLLRRGQRVDKLIDNLHGAFTK